MRLSWVGKPPPTLTFVRFFPLPSLFFLATAIGSSSSFAFLLRAACRLEEEDEEEEEDEDEEDEDEDEEEEDEDEDNTNWQEKYEQAQRGLIPVPLSDEDAIVSVQDGRAPNVTKEALGLGDWHHEVSTPSTLPEQTPFCDTPLTDCL